MDFGLEFIRKLRPCHWRYRPQRPEDDGRVHFGFIAQEVEKIAPHDLYGFNSMTEGGEYRMNMWEFIGPLTAAVQSLEKRIAELEARLEQKIETGSQGRPGPDD